MSSRWQCCATARPERGARRGVLRTAACCALAALLGSPAAVFAQSLRAEAATPIRFGVLPIGGAVESRDPLDAAARRAGPRDRAAGEHAVPHVLRIAGQGHPAQRGRPRPAAGQAGARRGHAAAHERAGPGRAPRGHARASRGAAGTQGRPGAGRRARAAGALAAGARRRRSVSGFMVPQLELFLPHGIAMETRFQSEIVDTQQGTALAVANGDADVATNNTTDFGRFRQQFPAEAERLQIIWRSEPTPPALFVVRRDHPASLADEAAGFPGRLRPRQGAARRCRTRGAQVPACGARLRGGGQHGAAAGCGPRLPAREAARPGAQWVNEAARRARLERIENAMPNRPPCCAADSERGAGLITRTT